MGLGILGVVLVLLLPGSRIEGYVDYEDFSEKDNEDNYMNYDVVDEEPVTSLSVINTFDDVSNRIRREQVEEALNSNTLSPEDFIRVKSVLEKLLSGIGSEDPLTPYSTAPSTAYLPAATEQTSSTPVYFKPETYSELQESTQISETETDYQIAESTDYPNVTEEGIWISIPELVGGGSNLSVRGFPTRSSLSELKNSLKIMSTVKNLFIARNGTTTNTTITTNTTTAKPAQIDVEKLREIIANLTKEFEGNLTKRLNDTIARLEIPTCTAPTTVLTTSEYDANYTGALIAKCFVCGLEIPGIPRHAQCGDAFASDFLPLVPVDSSAKGKLTGFRKYCKYANIRGYQYKRNRSRTILGRWTGGCAVRWVDLSGVYTQRTCRNRLKPTMGRHFASKRMAMLERALWATDSGCIASPVASLLPLSRGVSLYARFHACVCTGSWCNAARPPARRPPGAALCAALACALAVG